MEVEYENFKDEDKDKYMEIPHNVSGPAYLWRMNKPLPLNETRLGVCVCVCVWGGGYFVTVDRSKPRLLKYEP